MFLVNHSDVSMKGFHGVSSSEKDVLVSRILSVYSEKYAGYKNH